MKITIFNRDGDVTKPMYEAIEKKILSLESFPIVVNNNTEVRFDVEHKKDNCFKLE